jgi:hypothetical protein
VPSIPCGDDDDDGTVHFLAAAPQFLSFLSQSQKKKKKKKEKGQYIRIRFKGPQFKLDGLHLKDYHPQFTVILESLDHG